LVSRLSSTPDYVAAAIWLTGSFSALRHINP